MKTYTIQRHYPSGDAFALRHEGDAELTGTYIDGVCGPLHWSDWSDEDGNPLPDLDLSAFDYQTEDVAWAQDHPWAYPLVMTKTN